MTEMSEREATPEQQAEMAVANWLRIGSSAGLADIPHEQIRAWDDACEGLVLQPEKQIAAGWMLSATPCAIFLTRG